MNAGDVKRIRAKHKLSQSRFADLLDIPVRTLRDWEQGRAEPGSTGAALLKLADSWTLELPKR
jgi:putative transcriptional regulator